MARSVQRFEEVASEMPCDGLARQNLFNNTHTDYPKHKTVSQLFEECVVTFGDKLAVQVNEQSVTYNELNAKANHLASYLRKSGVGRHSVVAIYLERSLEFIISVLAIVKAGGVYLPLNPDDPINRMRIILQDSNPIKILTNTHLYHNPCNINCFNSTDKVVCLDTFFQDNIESIEGNQTCLNVSRDPIYIMYTSGSSGTPKGCVIPHMGVVRLVKNTNYIHFSSTDHIAQIANVAFDAMTFEMWGALLNGASLHIIPQVILLSVSDFAKALKQHKITTMFITVALLNLVVKNKPGAFDGLKYLIFGGEKANAEIIEILLRRKQKHHLKQLNLVNGYGPTECTTFAVTFLVEHFSSIKGDVPIGKPISNTQAYVLDKNLQFTPPGEVGELYLGGDGLALGYLNDRQQTATKFIQKPWNKEERIYKTGDLVYWLPDVGIVYLHREDAQVKINGNRVELSEVEATIVKNRAVKHAVVVAELDLDGRNELIAYVCFYENKQLNFAQFHQYLKENLPHYMRPKKIIQVDHIPLTANGKTDKVKLAERQGRNILETPTRDVPVNQLEKVVTQIWQKLLGVSLVNTRQNLFDLGAHSLMLGEACVLINSELSKIGLKPVSILDLLTYSTIQHFSDFASKREKSKVDNLNSWAKRARHQRQIMESNRSLHAI